MADNLTGTQLTTESNQTNWNQAGNGGLEQIHSAASPDDTTKEVGGLTETAHEYKDKIADVVSQAKDYLGDKVSTVGGRIKEFASDDLSGMANKAKDFARQNPGQAILVSAAAGLILGLIVRGRR
jgi:ElaB/YqjD/DUF883 family membrane-anchored ribosome-binding protein